MDWVSFDEIKRRVPLKAVIDRYGIQLRTAGPNKLRGKCPLRTHGSQKSNASFTATLNKGTGGAWACQSQSCVKARGRVGGNVLDFVAAMEGCSLRDAALKLQIWFLIPAAGTSDTQRGKEPLAEISAGKEPMRGGELVSENRGTARESECNKPLGFTLQRIDHSHPYLAERGITEETARKFGVGFFPGKGSMSGRIVIPIHNERGELVAYAGRSIDGSEPRYKFPGGFRKSLELFNLHRVIGGPSIVLVEGFFDCMKVTQAGYPCVALMGSTMSKAQGRLLGKHFGQVTIMLDGDDAGWRAALEIEERLHEAVFDVKVIALADGEQPDQFSDEAIRADLDGRV